VRRRRARSGGGRGAWLVAGVAAAGDAWAFDAGDLEQLPHSVGLGNDGGDAAAATAVALEKVDLVRSLVERGPVEVERPWAHCEDDGEDGGDAFDVVGGVGAGEEVAQLRTKRRQG
jgi:hypothetical protein